jgi:hypothetical protein
MRTSVSSIFAFATLSACSLLSSLRSLNPVLDAALRFLSERSLFKKRPSACLASTCVVGCPRLISAAFYSSLNGSTSLSMFDSSIGGSPTGGFSAGGTGGSSAGGLGSGGSRRGGTSGFGSFLGGCSGGGSSTGGSFAFVNVVNFQSGNSDCRRYADQTSLRSALAMGGRDTTDSLRHRFLPVGSESDFDLTAPFASTTVFRLPVDSESF